MPALLQGLVKQNATVRVEAQSTTRNNYGFTVESYTTLEDNVICSVTINGGSRDGRFDSQVNTMSGRISSPNPIFQHANIRVYFNSGPAAGVYARIEDLEQHGPGNALGLIADRWYSASWVECPAIT